ncbi:hypothetical protein STEG23_020553 [Scotinomys teguina]
MFAEPAEEANGELPALATCYHVSPSIGDSPSGRFTAEGAVGPFPLEAINYRRVLTGKAAGCKSPAFTRVCEGHLHRQHQAFCALPGSGQMKGDFAFRISKEPSDLKSEVCELCTNKP